MPSLAHPPIKVLEPGISSYRSPNCAAVLAA
jgi:hypothetical protein